jgi:predicted permease
MIPITLRSFPPPKGFSTAIFERAHIEPNLKTMKSVVIGDVGNTLWVLMGSIVVVLLAACANVANLLLVRVEGRRQELAIRAALGAGRGKIALGLLLESAVLSAAGAGLGLGLALGALKALVAVAPAGLPRLNEIGIDLPVLGFTLGITIFAGVAMGMIPVLKYAGIRVSTGLREGSRGSSQGRERARARKALVVVQVGLALVLLISSGLMIRTFRALVRVSPGFRDAKTVETFGVYIPDTQIPDKEAPRVLRAEQAIEDAIAAIPGVQSVAMSTAIPFSGEHTFNPVYAADRTYKEGEMAPLRRFVWVGPGYFANMGTRLAAGRELTWDEEFEKRKVALVSENFAREYWGSAESALGKRIRETPEEDWREIIGVVKDVAMDGVDKPAPTVAYWPLMMDNFNGSSPVMMRRGVSYTIRTERAGTAALLSEVQRAVWSVDAELPLDQPTTLGVLYGKSMARTSFTLVILSVAGVMALLLGMVGIYGVISYAVSQNTREIGIRMALGARTEALTAMYVRQGLALTGMGLAAGLAVALGCVRLMRTILYGVSPMDPWTYAVATVAIAGVAWLACYLPSRRAAGVDPVVALRAE